MVCIESLDFYNVIKDYSIYSFKLIPDNYHSACKTLGVKTKCVK